MRATTTTLSMSSYNVVSPFAISLGRREGGKTKAADPSLPARSLSRLPLRDLFQFPLILQRREGSSIAIFKSRSSPRRRNDSPASFVSKCELVSSAPTARWLRTVRAYHRLPFSYLLSNTVSALAHNPPLSNSPDLALFAFDIARTIFFLFSSFSSLSHLQLLQPSWTIRRPLLPHSARQQSTKRSSNHSEAPLLSSPSSMTILSIRSTRRIKTKP